MMSTETRSAAREKEIPGQTIIRARGLRKVRGNVTAIDGVGLEVGRGEFFGILGRGGSGKSTLLDVISGACEPDAGMVEVAGRDPFWEAWDAGRVLGVPLRATAPFGSLDLAGTLDLFAELHDADISPRRIRGLLEAVGLDDEAGLRVGELSEEESRRFSFALALVNDPAVVLLDDPTAGLGQRARDDLWRLVRVLRASGKTVVLATRSPEEAGALCDRVALLDRGNVLACDDPRSLALSMPWKAEVLASAGGDTGEISEADLDSLPGVLTGELDGPRLRLRTDDVRATVDALLDLAFQRKVSLEDLSTRDADLRDVLFFYAGGCSGDEPFVLPDPDEDPAPSRASPKHRRYAAGMRLLAAFPSLVSRLLRARGSWHDREPRAFPA